MNRPLLTPELENALSQAGGFVHGQSFVLMSIDTYRDMMGVGTDQEMRSSLDAIHRGLDDIEAGLTHDMEDVFRELDEDYGTTS